MTCCVYFIKAFNGNGLVKIGKTANLERRMRELKAPPDSRLLVIELPDEEIMHEVEQSIQDVFAQDRIPQSEMFSLTADQIKECKELMIEWEEYHSPPPLTPEQEEEERRIEELEAAMLIEELKNQLAREKFAEEKAKEQKAREAVLKEEKGRRDTYWATSFFLSIPVCLCGFMLGAAVMNTVSEDWHHALRGTAKMTAGLVVAAGCKKAVWATRNKYS